MGRLAELQAQIDAHSRGVRVQTPENRMDSHIESIVEAIQGIQLNMGDQEAYDYTPEMQKLGQSVVEALKVHGDALVQCLSGMTVSVEAPNVTVESPSISVNPEIEIELERKPEYFEVKRDRNGQFVGLLVRPYEETGDKPTMTME